MTDAGLHSMIKRTFGPDLSAHRAVDPGFDALVIGLVEAAVGTERARLEGRIEGYRRTFLELEENLADVRRDAVERCAEFLRSRGAAPLAARMAERFR